MKAMILAAGLGTRLLPFTRNRPKPLFPILNRPLLPLTVKRIRASGFAEIIINCHHLRQQISEALEHETGCIIQQEESILGTGGGLRKAMTRFNEGPVLVVNGDIYHTMDYKEIYRGHSAADADVTLVLHDYHRFNNVAVNRELMVTGFNCSHATHDGGARILAFTGIHVINPEVLRIIPPGNPSCIIDCYKELLSRGGTIRAHIADNHFWTDMGTREDYLQLHAGLLNGKIPPYDEFGDELREAPFAGMRHASIGSGVQFHDWACLGKGSVIGAGATVQRAVIWDGATVPAGSVVTDTIITD